MSYCLKVLLFLLLCVKQGADLTIAVRKFVYQKDMSEYCRRRVMPSVFLGRQVIGAYSQILQFSRLELPYSCFASIRTESGSNIILVIQLMSDKSLIESCRYSKNQLLVYEIGETFGGYWGPLPDKVLRHEATSDDINNYILKTTQPTSPETIEESTMDFVKRRTTPSTTTQSEDALKTPIPDRQDYIRIELPLVNMSAKLVPGVMPSNTTLDFEENFDMMTEVTSLAGMSYRTKLLPLVQFAIEEEVGARRTDEYPAISPRYKVDFNEDMFTPDSRLLPLLLAPATKKKHSKYNYSANRRLNFKKKKQLFYENKVSASKKPPFIEYRPPLYSVRTNAIFTKHYGFMQPPKQDTEYTRNSWEVIDDILKNISRTKDDVSTEKIDINLANLLYGLNKMDLNGSALSHPTSSPPSYTRRPAITPRTITTKYKTDSITWRQPSASYRTNYLDEVDDSSKVESLLQDANKSYRTTNAMNINDSVINNNGRSGPLLPPELDVDGVILNVTNQKSIEINLNHSAMLAPEVNGTTITLTTPKVLDTTISNNPDTTTSEVNGTTTYPTTSEIMKPLTLVDHESWENMVHAASLMAVMLNQSITPVSMASEKQELNGSLAKSTTITGRDKRYIQAIPIEHVKPRHLPIKPAVSTSTVHSDKIADVQELQRLVELQDDEIHNRVALRYLRQYVGPVLFNICDFDEAVARHVYLFNSSRLVLAITNFTLESMTVVLTPARTLLTSNTRCATAHLECQVSGARVCIDSLNACDGVPNCGSYDIYDEDRLSCGGAAGLQHNVCLAAVTFLAVLLTILYTVHYWLKRCVPKVSDAFFIYTDAAENVLYLDTIMRSPYDSEDGKEYFGGATIQDFMECPDIRIEKTNTVVTFINRLLKILGCKNKKIIARVSHDNITEEEYDKMHLDEHRIYSFCALELNKMAFSSDAAVQTGSSLELQLIDKIKLKERMGLFDSGSDDTVALYRGNKLSVDKRSILDIEMGSNQASDELSILKFFRTARSNSRQLSSLEDELAHKAAHHSKDVPHSEEKEIQCLEYERGDDRNDTAKSQTTTIAEVTGNKPEIVQKKLRFEEETINIPPENEDDALDEENADRPRRSIAFGSIRFGDNDSSTNNAEEHSVSTNREFKSYFWGGGKSKSKKSTKKKTHVSLR